MPARLKQLQARMGQGLLDRDLPVRAWNGLDRWRHVDPNRKKALGDASGG